MTEDSYRLAALFSHPIQYFAPLFRHVASQPEIDLTVYFCSRKGVEEYVDRGFSRSLKWDVPLLEGYRSRFLPRACRGERGVNWLNLSIMKEVFRESYDAIWVHGYMLPTNWLAFVAASAAGTPILLRGESNLLRRRPWWVRFCKGIGLRLLLNQVSACLYIGTRNREYYEHYGVPRRKLFFTPYCVDNDRFQRQSKRLGLHRAELRRRLDVPQDRPVIMYCGKLIPKKQPLMLLEAFAKVRKDLPCALLYVGDGELRPEIEDRVAESDIPDVRITGFLNQSEISKAYTAADILVLPSTWMNGDTETWGLTINEGMNFGLPVIVTDRVGCSADLVEDHANGYVVPHDNVAALSQAIRGLVQDSEMRHAFGVRSLEIIDGWNYEKCGEGIVKALDQVCE